MKQKTNKHLRTSQGNNDECYTYRYAVEPLLEYLEPFRDKIIWCPFDTSESEFVKVFTENGFNVVYSHIDFGQDFYTFEPEKWDILISNPPFSNKTMMFERVISFKKPFALLMNIAYLNDGIAAKTFKDIDLQILSFNERMNFKGYPKDKINFLSAYFCSGFLPKQIIFSDFRNRNQLNLFDSHLTNESVVNMLTEPTSKLFQEIKSAQRYKEFQKLKQIEKELDN